MLLTTILSCRLTHYYVSWSLDINKFAHISSPFFNLSFLPGLFSIMIYSTCWANCAITHVGHGGWRESPINSYNFRPPIRYIKWFYYMQCICWFIWILLISKFLKYLTFISIPFTI